jgi:hypothetical protein
MEFHFMIPLCRRLAICGWLLALSSNIRAADIRAWNGEESPARGKGWSQPEAAKIAPAKDQVKSGSTSLRIDLPGTDWRGVGWNWFGWYPADASTNAASSTFLVFALKASRPDATISVRLVDNAKGMSSQLDLVEAKVLDKLPTDWQVVRVPLKLFGEDFDRRKLWEIHIGTSSPGDLTLWIDDIGFSGEGGSVAIAAPGKPYVARISVDASKPLHTISPLIYGVSATDPKTAKASGVSTIRWGGNRNSRYNWKAKADNAGSDWFFLNGKSGSWFDFVDGNRRANITSYVTVPMLPWIAKGPEGWSFSVAKYGPQKKVEPYVGDRGDGTKPDGTPLGGNDPRDSSIPSTPEFQAEGIRSLPKDAKNPTIYGLDNEPMLWNSTHRDVFPQGLSYDECLNRGVALAKAIKQADASGLVAGPCTWGWTDLMYSAADAGADRYATHGDRKKHGDKPFLPWYLGMMKQESDRAGKRLLDYVDVHYYPQGQVDGQGVYGGSSHTKAMQSLRLRSTKALWDPTYRDESWINEPVMLISRVKAWIATENPGTKLVIGEYSWGGDDDPSGAVAEAEILGIFGQEKVDAAYFWAGLGGVQKYAFQLFRNADGAGHGFGDRSLKCRSDVPEQLSAFASLRDDGAVTIVLVNKDLERPAEVRLELVGGTARKAGGTIFRMPNPPGPIRKEVLAGDAKTIMVPALSAVLVVRP